MNNNRIRSIPFPRNNTRQFIARVVGTRFIASVGGAAGLSGGTMGLSDRTMKLSGIDF